MIDASGWYFHDHDLVHFLPVAPSCYESSNPYVYHTEFKASSITSTLWTGDDSLGKIDYHLLLVRSTLSSPRSGYYDKSSRVPRVNNHFRTQRSSDWILQNYSHSTTEHDFASCPTINTAISAFPRAFSSYSTTRAKRDGSLFQHTHCENSRRCREDLWHLRSFSLAASRCWSGERFDVFRLISTFKTSPHDFNPLAAQLFSFPFYTSSAFTLFRQLCGIMALLVAENSQF